jgi:uncharacterized membrane protein SirB2
LTSGKVKNYKYSWKDARIPTKLQKLFGKEKKILPFIADILLLTEGIRLGITKMAFMMMTK